MTARGPAAQPVGEQPGRGREPLRHSVCRRRHEVGPLGVQPCGRLFGIGELVLHLDGDDGTPTRFITCNNLLPANPTACRVRTLTSPAVLRLHLTGSDAFLCEPCVNSPLKFELALVTNGNAGPCAEHYLMRIKRLSPGFEQAHVMLNMDIWAGEYRLRVRNTQRPEMANPLTVEFGPPN